jgi:predicted transcriptional regulator of viral defense system
MEVLSIGLRVRIHFKEWAIHPRGEPPRFSGLLFYNMSVKIKKRGLVGLRVPNRLQSLLQKNGGTITTAEANVVGISNERLRLLAKSGELERVAHGVYISPDDFLDKMCVAQRRRPKVIYSHETALFQHGLTDRDPVSYSVTVPSGYNTKAILAGL